MIVKTLLDTDLYKFTTSYAYIKLFPYAIGTFSFNDRNETKYTEAFLETLKTEIKNFSQLSFTEEELEYMTKNCRFLPRVYWEWLSSFRFDPNKIDIHLDEACHLHIEVADLLYMMKENIPAVLKKYRLACMSWSWTRINNQDNRKAIKRKAEVPR